MFKISDKLVFSSFLFSLGLSSAAFAQDAEATYRIPFSNAQPDSVEIFDTGSSRIYAFYVGKEGQEDRLAYTIKTNQLGTDANAIELATTPANTTWIGFGNYSHFYETVYYGYDHRVYSFDDAGKIIEDKTDAHQSDMNVFNAHLLYKSRPRGGKMSDAMLKPLLLQSHAVSDVVQELLSGPAGERNAQILEELGISSEVAAIPKKNYESLNEQVKELKEMVAHLNQRIIELEGSNLAASQQLDKVDKEGDDRENADKRN